MVRLIVSAATTHTHRAQDDVAGCFDYYADLAERLDARQYEHVELPDDSFDTKIIRQPLGVIALITPWNYPLLMAAVCVFSTTPNVQHHRPLLSVESRACPGSW